MNKIKVELIVFLFMLLGFSLVSCQPNYRFIHPEDEGKAQNCDPLPNSFNEEDLAGTWQAEYFGGLASDILIIREDGKFKQILTSEPRNFESEWQNWWFEFYDDGYGVLHLTGMRRCDDMESICNNLEGGLPAGELAINQCNNEYIHYSNETILLVVPRENAPRDIVLLHPRLAGSDFSYSFRLLE